MLISTLQQPIFRPGEGLQILHRMRLAPIGWSWTILPVLNVGNGWEWGNGMIIDCGSFPHSLRLAPVSLIWSDLGGFDALFQLMCRVFRDQTFWPFSWTHRRFHRQHLTIRDGWMARQVTKTMPSNGSYSWWFMIVMVGWWFRNLISLDCKVRIIWIIIHAVYMNCLFGEPAIRVSHQLLKARWNATNTT